MPSLTNIIIDGRSWRGRRKKKCHSSTLRREANLNDELLIAAAKRKAAYCEKLLKKISLFTVDFHLFFRRSCLKAKLKRVGYWRQSESKRNEKRTPDIASPSASAWLIWSLLLLRYFLSKTHHSSSLTPRGKPGYIRKQNGRRASAAIYVYYHPPSSLL